MFQKKLILIIEAEVRLVKNSKDYIDMNKLKKAAREKVTPQMRQFVESQIGREWTQQMTEEAWMDFFLGVSLWGISVGIQRLGR